MTKQNWVKRHWLLIRVLIVSMILIFVWGVFVYSKTSDYVCSKHPEKCVCEKYQNKELTKLKTEQWKENQCTNPKIVKGGIFEDTHIICQETTNKCSKFRLKTQAELQAEANIKSCQDNPREDKDCKCEETICTACIKSHPKTDWEKHPEEYVAEIIYPIQEKTFYDTRELVSLNTPNIIVNLTNSFYFYHEYSKNYMFNFQEIINDKPYLDRNFILDKIIVRFKDLNINQTTYRRK